MDKIEQLKQLELKRQELIRQQNEVAEMIKNLKDNKKWQPKKDEVYYFVSGDGDVEKCPHRNSFYDRWRIPQGNCFNLQMS
jgi:MoaA/NifB/PqqE/SkfB family radical SAM enzyme